MSQHRHPTDRFGPELGKLVSARMNRLAKWRSLFTGWQLGTRAKGDPEGDAVRDANEARILMRVEINALTGLLINKGFFTEREFGLQLVDEAEYLNRAFEEKFPGITATDDGLHLKLPEALETMQRYRFKP